MGRTGATSWRGWPTCCCRYRPDTFSTGTGQSGRIGSGISTCLIIQHVAPELPFALGAALARRGVDLDLRAVFAGDALPPDLAGFDGLVVMGGPMSAYDDAGFPTRRAELGLLADAVAAGVPTLGVCLGAQLLAQATGGAAVPGQAGLEVGWSSVSFTADVANDPLLAGIDGEVTVLHWHGDTYQRPPEAVHLASSAQYPEQAFRIGDTAWGLQFHLEVDAAAVEGFVDVFRGEADAAPGGAAGIVEQTCAAIEALRPVRDRVLDRFASLVAAPAAQPLGWSDWGQQTVTEL
jgi:GMP synthase-like glutamine amidotransferase